MTHREYAIVAYFLARPKVASNLRIRAKAAIMQSPHLINLLHGEMTAWRQDLHAHPELGPFHVQDYARARPLRATPLGGSSSHQMRCPAEGNERPLD